MKKLFKILRLAKFEAPRPGLGGTIRIVGTKFSRLIKLLRLGWVLKIIARILVPTRNLSKKNKRILIVCSIGVILILVPAIVYTLSHLKSAEAAWFNANWSFRKSIAITAHTSAETNVYVNLTGANAIDTSDTSRFQADCGDLRFTDVNGKILPYYIVSGCGTGTTIVHVFFQSMPAGAQTVYYYYGNPSAENGFRTSDFSTEASSYTIGSLGSEEVGVAPIANWKFDEGAGTTASDSSANKNTATLLNLDTPPSTRSGWMMEDSCVSGKCIKFAGGSSGSVTVSNTISGVKTVSFWVKPASSSASMIDLNGSNVSIIATTGTITAPNFTSPTIYVNGVASSTLTANEWNYVTVTSGTAITASAIKIGNVKGDYLNGYMDDVRFYGYARTAAQVKVDYNLGSGSVLGASDANKNLTNGLVGHWKMNEATWSGTLNEVLDSSGAGNNGRAEGATNAKAYPAPAKFGNGGFFDGVDDYVSVANSSSLNFGTEAFTVGAWIKSTSNGGHQHIVGKRTGSTAWYRLYIRSTGVAVFELANSYPTNYIQILGTTNVSDGRWHYVSGTRDASGKISLYVDSVLENSNTANYDVSSTSDLFIGRYPTNLFNGNIDEVRAYNRSLSPAEIEQLYNFAPGPVAYYDFEEGKNSTLNDRSGNGNTGTWGGTAPYWTQGKYGKAGSFNGINDEVQVPAASSIDNLANGDFSVSTWIRMTGHTTNSSDPNWRSRIIEKRRSSAPTRGWLFSVSDDKALNFTTIDETGGADTNTISANNLVILNKWQYVTAVYSSSSKTIRIYIDGKEVPYSSQTVGNGSDFSDSDKYLSIGNATTGETRYFNGQIDNVKIYNYTQTPGQIVSDMNAGHPAPGSPVGSAFGHWKFDEGYGTTANNSGNAGGNIPGTLTNMASPATAVSGWSMSGKYNKAIRFDGLNDFVSIANNPSALQITSDLSISAWINLSNNTVVHDIVSKKGAGGQYGYRLSTTTSGNIQFELSSDGSTVRAATGSATLTANKWYHVVGVYNPGNSITVYIDGRQDGQVTTSMPASTFNSSANVNIGAGNNGASNFFAGAIDEPKIYNGILTLGQVKLDYNRGSSQVLGSLSDTSGLTGGSVASNSASAEYCIPGDTVTCAPPVARWDLNEGAGISANDSSGNGNTGAWSGTGNHSTQGKYGKGGGFNGVDDYVDISTANLGSVVTKSGNYTISLWFNTILPNKNQSLFNWSLSSSDRNGINITSRLIQGGYYNGTAYVGNITTIPVEGSKWVNVVLTNTAGTTAMYVNGVSIAAGSISNLGSTSPSETIGYNTNMGAAGTGYFSGKIDDVRVYNYPRTAAQVAWDYNRGAPVGWWKFDECQGSIIHDSSVNGIHGTWNGSGGGTQTAVGTCSTASSAWGNGVTGKFNSSLNFDGTDDYVDIGTNSNLRPTSSVTVSGWLKRSGSLSTNSGIVSVGKNTSNNGGYVLLGTTSNTLRFYIDRTGAASWVFAETNSALTLNQWYYIVAMWDGTTVKLYVDGVLQTTTGSGSTIVYNSGKNDFIGLYGHPVNDHYWTGQIDDVRIFNYALTKQQIQMVQNQGSAIRFGPSTGSP